MVNRLAKVIATEKNNDILNSLLKDHSETINWSKALPLTRYSDEAPAINLENIEEIVEANVCPSEINIRDLPSNNFSVLTSHYDPLTNKWYESRRASHPFISVKMTKINPNKRNKCED